jgi:hypothetical protein
MPDKSKEQSLAHISEMKNQNTNHLIQHDPEIKGEVDIEVRTNGRYNVTVYKGPDEKPRIISDISKNKLIEMIQNQL